MIRFEWAKCRMKRKPQQKSCATNATGNIDNACLRRKGLIQWTGATRKIAKDMQIELPKKGPISGKKTKLLSENIEPVYLPAGRRILIIFEI